MALGVYMRPAGDTEKRDALLLMGRHTGLVTARQPMPLTEWWPLPNSGTRAHWMRFGPTRAFGPPAAVLVCYEQLLVWPVAEAFLGSTRPRVLIGVSDHWWVEPGTLDATEARMQARVLRAWGRLYGVLVIFADNRPRGAHDLAVREPVVRQPVVVSPPIRTKYGQNTDKDSEPMTQEPKKLPKKEAIRTKYGQNTDKIRTSPENGGGRTHGRLYGSSTVSSKTYRIMAPPYPLSPRTYPPLPRTHTPKAPQ